MYPVLEPISLVQHQTVDLPQRL